MAVKTDKIERVAVVGAGQMGRGIGAVTALAGYEVTLTDIDESQLNEAADEIEWSYEKTVDRGDVTKTAMDAALERFTFTTDFEAAVGDADFVTEAAAEQQSIKEGIFKDLDDAAPEDAILATNTSGLNVTNLATTTDRADQVVGTHWFNPPMLMDLVEVVLTEHTSDSVRETAMAFVESVEKTPILCKKDVPSFVVNRLMRPYCEGAAWLVHRGEHTIEEVDAAMTYREGFPMGPFELTDYTGGVQLWTEGEQDHLEDDRPMSYEAKICPILKELYQKGRYGRKTDAGFYDYGDRDDPAISVDAGRSFDTLLVWAPIVNEATKILQNGVATVEDVDTGVRLGGNWPIGPFEKADEVGADVILGVLTEVASRHEETIKLAETLPCELLVEKAKTGETFY